MKSTIIITFNILLWLGLCFASYCHNSTIYIFFQAKGQFSMLMNTQSFQDFEKGRQLSKKEKDNLILIESIKKYSVDSLFYKPTDNFTKIYDQGRSPLLWVVTASQKFKIEPYYWYFPIVGEVSYKGFFDEQKAQAEKNRLICAGYDVDLRSVSAWSTLGWFKDPVLSSMLSRSKGSLCNLIFHELFHATYYAKSSVDFNENLASFVAHKATLRFLSNDTTELNTYVNNDNDNILIQKLIGTELKELNRFYDSIAPLSDSQKNLLKLKKLNAIQRSISRAPIKSKRHARAIQENISEFKNAWFVDFNQYNGMQDSLEGVFNKIYQSDIARMVQSLK